MSGNVAGSKRKGDRIESPDGSPLLVPSPALKARIGRRLGLGVEQLDKAVSRLTRRRDPGSSGGDDACPDFSSLELEPLPPA